MPVRESIAGVGARPGAPIGSVGSDNPSIALDWRMSGVTAHAVAALVGGLLTAAAIVVSAQPVMAQEAFKCGGGRVVHVSAEAMRMIGQDDPCLAAFILRRQGEAATAAGAQSAQPIASTSLIAPDSAPEPMRHPLRAPVQTAGNNTAGIEDGPTIEVVVSGPDKPLLAPRVTPVTFQSATATPVALVAKPAGPLDYRNVPIINAAPGEPRLFVHTR